MCGIAGIVLKNNIALENNKVLKNNLQRIPEMSERLWAMTQSMKHRGPDEQNIYSFGTVGLAHARLSIIDLSSGQQPMQTPEGDLVISFNGEIFNYLELRRDLQQKGHVFRTQSDTEVILYLYREYGLDFPNYLNGQFAIALFDQKKQKIILVRDRVGICPLYYFSDQNQFIFSSEIKAIRVSLGAELSIDPVSLDEIFTGWTCLNEKTIFKNIFQLNPGELFEVSMSGEFTRKTYWNFNFPTTQDEYDQRPEGELIDRLEEHLLAATEIRLRADVPVGAYLSGGLDSSLVVALIQSIQPKGLRTFSLEFNDQGYDESIYQQQMVRHLKTEHSALKISADNIADLFVKTIRHTESPILRTAPVPMGLLSRFVAQQNYKVVLTGEGADEILGGYDIFKEAKVRQFWAKNPDSKIRPLLLTKLYPYLQLPKGDATDYLKKFFGVGLNEPDLFWHSHLPRWQTTAKAKMFYSSKLQDQLQTQVQAHQYELGVEKLFPQVAKEWHWFNRAQYLEIKTLMANYLLNSQGDRMLMMNSLEGRFPYLDHRLIEFANRLRPSFKMRAMTEKYLLKKVASRWIPTDIFKRSKQPYRAPDVFTNTKGLESAGLMDYVSESEINSVGLFDAKKVALLGNKVRSGKPINISESQAFTGILSTQIVHNEFCQSN